MLNLINEAKLISYNGLILDLVDYNYASEQSNDKALKEYSMVRDG